MSTFVKVKKTSKVLIWFSIALVSISGAMSYISHNKVGADSYSSSCGIPLYKQTMWTSTPYGYSDEAGTKPATIATSGCGPTALAMVMTAYGHYMTPGDAASYCLSNGYRKNGEGTDPGCFAAMAQRYGMGIEKQYDRQTVKNYLTNGYPAIVLVGPGPDGKYTSGGHYIVLTRLVDTTVYINDPNKNIASDSFANIYDKYWKNGFWFLYNPA